MKTGFKWRRTAALAAMLMLAAGAVAPGTVAPAWADPVDPPAEAPRPRNPFAPRFAPLFADAALRPVGAGTGFTVRADGRFATNNHVIDNCAGVSVTAIDGTEVVARVVAADAAEDVALLEASLPPIQPFTFRQLLLTNGQYGLVIGYPDHGLPRITPYGVTAALTGPPLPNGHRFAIRADVRHGNSGGPLLDAEGLVVGMVVAKLDTAAVYQQTHQHVEKVGFAISNEVVTGFLRAHGVEPQTAAAGTQAEEQALFDTWRRSVVRVVCWRAPAAGPR